MEQVRAVDLGRFQRFFSPVDAYAAVLAIAAVGLAGGLWIHGFPIGAAPPLALLVLAATALLAERQSVRVATHTEMSVSVLPILFAAVVFGPLPAMIVGASALVGDFGRPHARWVIWTSQRALVAGLAGLAASSIPDTPPTFGAVLAAVVVAAVTDALVDGVLTTLMAAVRGNNIRETARSMIGLLVGAVPLYTPVLAALAYTYEQVSPWVVLFFFAPAVAAQRLFLLYQEQRELAQGLSTAYERLERANLSFATALVEMLDARDRYTAGHSAAVAIYSRDIARRIGLSEEQQRLAHVCGLVHDIGKVGLPAGLLEKAGALTLEERRQMEAHSAIGARILLKVEDYAEIAMNVRHHHERVDGNGYPDGLVGDEIPLIARIIAVADAYNAMTSDRPYRDAMPSRVARLRLAQAVETQFDTSVVAAFEALLAGGSETYRSGSGPTFDFEKQLGVEPIDARAALAVVG